MRCRLGAARFRGCLRRATGARRRCPLLSRIGPAGFAVPSRRRRGRHGQVRPTARRRRRARRRGQRRHRSSSTDDRRVPAVLDRQRTLPATLESRPRLRLRSRDDRLRSRSCWRRPRSPSPSSSPPSARRRGATRPRGATVLGARRSRRDPGRDARTSRCASSPGSRCSGARRLASANPDDPWRHDARAVGLGLEPRARAARRRAAQRRLRRLGHLDARAAGAIARIDVDRGAEGDAFGSDALGGVIHIVTPDRSTSPPMSTGGEARHRRRRLRWTSQPAAASGALSAFGAAQLVSTDGSIPRRAGIAWPRRSAGRRAAGANAVRPRRRLRAAAGG